MASLRAAFLYNEVIKTSAADEDQLADTLENLCTILAAVCNHRELMDVRLRTIPTIWKDMIESLRQHLQVHVDDIEREYQSMLELNQRIQDQISHVEEQYSKSESSQQMKAVLHGDDLSKWAQMMRDYVASHKREDQKNTMQEETSDKEEPHEEEPARTEVVLRDAPITSVEEKHKSQKKGLFSFRPALPAEEVSKDKSSRSIEKAKQDISEDKEVAVCQKVKTILQAFSADHDIFWFRHVVVPKK